MSTLAILGCGTMGEAILGGLLAAGRDPATITVTARRAPAVAEVLPQAAPESASAPECASSACASSPRRPG